MSAPILLDTNALMRIYEDYDHMTTYSETTEKDDLDVLTRIIHLGLSGFVQTFGLLTFTGMALTGSLMFFYLQPGQKAGGLLHFIEEIHEIGEGLIPVFLALHAGAVLLHALAGRPKWRKVLFLKEK